MFTMPKLAMLCSYVYTPTAVFTLLFIICIYPTLVFGSSSAYDEHVYHIHAVHSVHFASASIKVMKEGPEIIIQYHNIGHVHRLQGHAVSAWKYL